MSQRIQIIFIVLVTLAVAASSIAYLSNNFWKTYVIVIAEACSLTGIVVGTMMVWRVLFGESSLNVGFWAGLLLAAVVGVMVIINPLGFQF